MFIVETNGAFNEEGVKVAVQAYQKRVLSNSYQNWCSLELWDDEALGSPEALAMIKQLWRWSLENGCKTIAVVVKNSLQMNVMEKNKPEQVNIFRHQVDALAWLRKWKLKLLKTQNKHWSVF